MTLPSPAELLPRIAILLIALPLHELAHAWTADRFGDPTPRSQGRLSLNPLRHLDPLGALLVLAAGFGWAKPVMIDPYALSRRSPAARMLVSLAGPAANLLLALLFAIPLRLSLIPKLPATQLMPSGYTFVAEFVWINLLLMVFNLLPVPPLDGFSIARYLLPPSAQPFLHAIERYGGLVLIGLVFLLPFLGINVLGWIIGPVVNTLYGLIVGGA
jgi:Zn-dependent protease